MHFDYDLAIIGGHPVGREAALVARSLRGRVALIEPLPPAGQLWAEDPMLAWWGVGQILQAGNQVNRLPCFRFASTPGEMPAGEFSPSPLQPDWQAIKQWVRGAIANVDRVRSPEALAMSGVDVIWGQGQFFPKPRLGLSVIQDDRVIRTLHARAYLLAPGSFPVIPDIPGLETVPYLTPDRLWQEEMTTLPERLLILGSGAIAVELAQSCAGLGSQVALVTSADCLLPVADPNLAHLLQVQLEADGVTIFKGEPVIQVRQLDESIWLQVGDRALETDAVLLAGAQQPNVRELNLERVGVVCNERGKVLVGRRLRTRNPRIYACGEAAWLGAIAPATESPDCSQPISLALVEQQVHVAVKNSLFFPWHFLDSQTIVHRLNTDPPLVQVGLTEEQARRRDRPQDVVVLQQTEPRLPHAQMRGDMLNYCKVLVDGSNGRILGAHWLGANADDGIGAIALAMQNDLHITDLINLPAPSPTATDLLHRTVQQWNYHRLKSRPWFTNLLESWCNFRRG
jgi:pyruvate/2-oxoglutarate dehydrogenase complex dihydrolipoamide dehydrogenase (E3) component